MEQNLAEIESVRSYQALLRGVALPKCKAVVLTDVLSLCAKYALWC